MIRQHVKACVCLLLLISIPIFLLPSRLNANASEETPPPQTTSMPAATQKSLTLQKAYDLALRQSETLAMKRVDVERTWSDFLAAMGDAIGEGNLLITQFRQDESFGTSGSTGSTSTSLKTSRRERRFEFEQPLFQGLHSVGLFEEARHLRSEKIYERKRAEQTLMLDVSNAFYTVLEVEKDIDITKAIIKLFKERMGELEEWGKIGKSRPSEVATAEARLSAGEAELARLRKAHLFARRTLEFLTGVPLDDVHLEENQKIRESPAALETYLPQAKERPDVKAEEQAVRGAFGSLLEAQSGLWPEISLNSSVYNKREGFQKDIDYDILFTVDVPLYTGGETLGETQAAASDLKNAKLEYRMQKRVAELEIKQAYDNWTTTLAEYDALRRAVETSELNYRLQKEDYEKNLVNNLDVLEALNSLSEAQISENHAYYAARRFHIELQVATGLCCESI